MNEGGKRCVDEVHGAVDRRSEEDVQVRQPKFAQRQAVCEK